MQNGGLARLHSLCLGAGEQDTTAYIYSDNGGKNICFRFSTDGGATISYITLGEIYLALKKIGAL